MSDRSVVADLLDRVAGARRRVREFNPVTLLVRRELDLSRLLAWLLDPLGDHGLGTAPLSGFLDLAGISHNRRLSLCRVELEVPRYVGAVLAGRIDIELVHPDFVVLVENKPFAGFGDRQLERYVRALPANGTPGRVIALLGRGWRNEALAGLEAQTGARALRLGIEIRDWVIACTASAPPGRARSLLEAFSENLDERHGGMGGTMMTGTVDEVAATPASMAAAMAIIEAREAIAARMTQDFSARVARRLAGTGIGAVSLREGSRPLFGGNLNGILCIDIGLEGFDVALGADGTYFSWAFLSLRARREIPKIGKRHAETVAKLTAALGSSSDTDLHDLYLWWRWIEELGPAGTLPADGPGMWAWAADDSDDGLAAVFVAKASEMKAAVGL